MVEQICICCLPLISTLIIPELVVDFVNLPAGECDSIQSMHIFPKVVS